MDFKRVEGIFLVVFLCLNMFLFYIYQEGKNEQDFVSTGTISDNIEERLKLDGIQLPKEALSQKKRQGYYLSAEEAELGPLAKQQLTGQEWQVTGSRLYSHYLQQSDMVVSESDEGKRVKRFIEIDTNTINGSLYTLDKHETKQGRKYTFSQEWEGIPFYDETSELVVNIKQDLDSKSIIDSYEQTLLVNVEPLREQQSLISEREALISLYTNNRLQPNAKIKWVDLGYTRIFTVKDKGVYIPAWFVASETNKNTLQVERVNAFTSAVISSNVSEVKN
ncbi:MAG: two-component system regulatory protein YycI [Vagococcus sp.]